MNYRLFDRIAAVVALLLVLALGLTTTGQGLRQGAWVDKVVFYHVPVEEEAIDMIQAGKMDLYASGISNPDLYKRILAFPDLGYETSYGSYNELSFNPVGPTFPETGKFNPFHFPKIREANELVHRPGLHRRVDRRWPWGPAVYGS